MRPTKCLTTRKTYQKYTFTKSNITFQQKNQIILTFQTDKGTFVNNHTIFYYLWYFYISFTTFLLLLIRLFPFPLSSDGGLLVRSTSFPSVDQALSNGDRGGSRTSLGSRRGDYASTESLQMQQRPLTSDVNSLPPADENAEVCHFYHHFSPVFPPWTLDTCHKDLNMILEPWWKCSGSKRTIWSWSWVSCDQGLIEFNVCLVWLLLIWSLCPVLHFAIINIFKANKVGDE